MHFRAAVIGHPIAHSLSPALHAAAYGHLGLPIRYDRQDLTPAELPGFLAALPAADCHGADPTLPAGASDPWVGLSVTMPHKRAAAAAARIRSERVELLGVANTLVWGRPQSPGERSPGPWAHNTDVDGIVGALGLAGLSALQGARTVGVVGNGGTAAAAVLAAAQLGAAGVELFVRRPERAESTAALARRCGLTVQIRALDELVPAVAGLAAVVCTLPPRAADPWAAQLGRARPGAGLPPLLDVAYDPWPSALGAAWEEAGGAVASGLQMLLCQAVEQVRLFAAAAVHRSGDAAAQARLQQADWDEVAAVMAAAVGLPAAP